MIISNKINNLIAELITYNNIEGIDKLKKKELNESLIGEIESMIAFAKIKHKNDVLVITPAKQENEKGDFYIIHDGVEFYFEVLTILSDGKEFLRKLRDRLGAGFSEKQLRYRIIEKYFKQFKWRNNKSLVINYNNHFNIGIGFHLGFKSIPKYPQRTILSKLFSTESYPYGYSGLFHNDEVVFAEDKNISNTIKLKISFFQDMASVYAISDQEIIQAIKQPSSKNMLFKSSINHLCPNHYAYNSGIAPVCRNSFEAYKRIYNIGQTENCP